MGERKFTLIEYHNHDGGGIHLFSDLKGINPFGDGREESIETTEDEPEGAPENDTGSGLQVLIAIGFLVGIAVVVRWLLGEEGEDIEYEGDGIEVAEYED